MLLKSTFIGFFLIVATSLVVDAQNCTPCPYAYRCNPYYSEELIWAIADGICKVFPNSCVYGSEQCNRQTACASPMTETTKDLCPCASNCDSLPQSTVCAWIPNLSATGTPGEASLEFNNKCHLDKWSCENGRPYGSFNPGSCQ